MKKFLLVTAIILVLLFIIDKTILKDKGIVEQSGELEKIENPDTLPVGLAKGEKAPSFTLNDLDGNEVSLEDYRGKKILLNFWASWCPPCRAEMPDMEDFYKENKDEDFVVLAVNGTFTEDSREDVTTFVNDFQLTFPIVMDEQGEVGHQFDIISFPTSYFIDSDGVVRNKIIGALSKEILNDEMKKLP